MTGLKDLKSRGTAVFLNLCTCEKPSETVTTCLPSTKCVTHRHLHIKYEHVLLFYCKLFFTQYNNNRIGVSLKLGTTLLGFAFEKEKVMSPIFSLLFCLLFSKCQKS